MFRGGHYNSRKRVSLWVRAIRIGHPWAGTKKNSTISVLPPINAEASAVSQIAEANRFQQFAVRISIARIATGFTTWLKQHFADQIRMSEPVALGPGQTYAASCSIIAVTGKSGLDNPSKSVASNIATESVLIDPRRTRTRSLRYIAFIIIAPAIKYCYKALVIDNNFTMIIDLRYNNEISYTVPPRYPKCVSVFKDVVQGVPSRCNG
ncbi:hypothetical protein ALC57_12158 [Trachymyrmex cornetzi]|uniref:Uncharacterized protein n=1 Tax=Trachymyrmex cornetzi TaxID=471704 RepID=A0A195DRV9_9HYME|nr:hypothetical protein ALC57_12158 [Trachymyrmex cornetzi]